MISRHMTKHRSGRRFITAFAVTGLIAGTLIAGGTALAVRATGAFELEGNAVNGLAGDPAGDDWDNVCHQAAPTQCPTGSNTTGATAVSFIDAADDPIIFTGGGSKDPED